MTTLIQRAAICISTLLICLSLWPEVMGQEKTDGEGPLSKSKVTEMTAAFERSAAVASEKIKADPKNGNAYSQRGDARFFLGQFADAVADYDKMIEFDETLATSHWRRGIALFYANRFKEAAAQFESYHAFDQVDRENGIWRYLSQHKAHGREKAREGLLKYKKDDREPFPAVYKLFAGTITPKQILAEIEQADIGKAEREKRLFYAHLYIGLNHAVEGESEAATQHLRLSTLNTWGPEAGYGPHYMWHVGRLHEEQLRLKAKSK